MRIAVVSILAGVGACTYDPAVHDCEIVCASTGETCPDGFVCGGEGLCRPAGFAGTCAGGSGSGSGSGSGRVVDQTETLQMFPLPGLEVQLLLDGGPGDEAQIALRPRGGVVIDWDIHDHTTQQGVVLVGQQDAPSVDFDFKPTVKQPWYLRMASINTVAIQVDVHIELRGNMVFQGLAPAH